MFRTSFKENYNLSFKNDKDFNSEYNNDFVVTDEDFTL